MTTTADRLHAMLVADYQVDPARLQPGAQLEDLGIDSIGLAELMFNIEDVFNITLPAEAMMLPTLEQVVYVIDGLVALRGAATGAATNSAADAPVPQRLPRPAA